MGALLIALTFLGYFSASIGYVAALYENRWRKWGLLSSVLGLSAQSVWLIQKTVMLGSFPDETLYDWIATFTWLSVIIFLTIQLLRPALPLGGFLMPITTMIWLGSQALSRRLVVPPHLHGELLKIHISAAVFAYVAFLLATVFSIMYTEKERELKRKRVRLFYYELPSLEIMDTMSTRLIVAGLTFYSVALVSGMLWAKHIFNAYWSWSAQETWSVLVWLVYAVYLVLRIRGWRGHKAAVYSMSAFLLVIVDLFVVGAFFHGFHFYNV